MSKTALTPVAAPGAYAAAGVVFTPAAADAGNGNDFPVSGNDLVIAFNSDASPHHVTITSQPDSFGRKGDITSESIAAGAYHMYGPFKPAGWASGGRIAISADDATVEFTIIQIPG